MSVELTRRGALTLGATFVAAAGLLGSAALVPAQASAEAAGKMIDAFTGGAKPQVGRVTLGAPEIAENGNTVPISVSVESPMTADDYVVAVLIVAPGNPNPGVATLLFSPLSGKAEASTRMRLAKTQDVIAVAKMSDGSFFMDTRSVKVTIGGCGG
ncbi:MAG: thiosulfate oxidation carrier protein SoxY [Alphaproteobacteria bacterium]